jgi:gliding motility-associated-like protein
MFRLFFISVFTLFSKTLCLGQPNLVPNPGFEEISQCPSPFGEFSLLNHWFIVTDSPDLYSICQPMVSPLGNFYGKQLPLSGENYPGAVMYVNNGSNGREYFGVKLINKLIAGAEYCVTFYVSLADTCDYAINNIGCLFTKTIPTPTGPGNVINIAPQILNNGVNNPLTSKTEWMKIEGSFVAQGDEEYLTIGNFSDDNSTDTIFIGGSNLGIGYLASYYWVEDVTVKICNYAPPVVVIPNIFTPNNDGINDVFYIQTEFVGNYHLDIFNRWGVKLKELSPLDSIWDGTFNSILVNDGVYFYNINYVDLLGETFTSSGFIHLMKN